MGRLRGMRNCGLRIADCGLRIDCGLSDCGWRIAIADSINPKEIRNPQSAVRNTRRSEAPATPLPGFCWVGWIGTVGGGAGARRAEEQLAAVRIRDVAAV